MCVSRGLPASEGLSMRSDSSDTIVRLGMATIIVQRGRQTERLSVHTASLVVTSGRRPIHLVLGGPTGSVTVQLSRTADSPASSTNARSLLMPDLASYRAVRRGSPLDAHWPSRRQNPGLTNKAQDRGFLGPVALGLVPRRIARELELGIA